MLSVVAIFPITSVVCVSVSVVSLCSVDIKSALVSLFLLFFPNKTSATITMTSKTATTIIGNIKRVSRGSSFNDSNSRSSSNFFMLFLSFVVLSFNRYL